MATAYYSAGFSPPPGMISTGARRSVWSPPGMGGHSMDGPTLGLQQPPPYGYSSQQAYPPFSYSNTNTAAAYANGGSNHLSGSSHGYYAPQHNPTARYSLPAATSGPTTGITGQGTSMPYAPVMAHRRPSTDLSSGVYPYSTSAAPPQPAQHTTHYSSASTTAALYPHLPVARAFSQPGTFTSQRQAVYDPPPHPPPAFHQHHQHPPPPYHAYDHNGGRYYSQSPENWLAASQPQQLQPAAQQYSNLPPRLQGLGGVAQPQPQPQQQQQPVWGPADNWNPWADAGYDQPAPAPRAPATKGVGGANWGAVGEKRTKRVDVVADVKDPAAFAPGRGVEMGSKDLDWEQLMNAAVVYPDYDQPSYAQPPQHTSPPPPPDPLPAEYQLVPPSNPVLPPPPIEKSAVPLSAVGAGMIWELCSLPVAGLSRKVGSSAVESASPKSNVWIPVPAVDDSFSLDQSTVDADSWSPWADSKPSQKAAADPTKPTSEFKAFVESILTQTLLTPQVLLLAILYVAKVVGSATLPLPVDSPLADVERAPYKMFLAGIMIANKILDDNSYRTETFGQVSGVSLPELNSIEVFFLGALDWKLTADRDEWRSWMAQVSAWNRYWHPSTPGKADAAATAMLASLLDQAAADEDQQRSPSEAAFASFEMPATTYASPQDYSVDFFQDAMGPVKSPFQLPRVVAWQGTNGEV